MRAVLFFLIMLFLPVSIFMHAAYAAEQEKALYTCPMHPDYVSDKPGSCPICGMDLVKKEAHEGHLSSGVRIDPDQQQLIGVRTEEAAVRRLVAHVRANARAVLDKELYDAQAEYLGSDLVSTKLWNNSRQKLLFLGMSPDEIEELKKRRFADRDLIFTDLSGKDWVYASVYEHEMALVKPGQKVELTASAYPGKIFQGVVTGVAQQLDPQTRTVRVRIRVPDEEKILRPEMFLLADIQVDLGEKLSVPSDALIDTGRRKVVYVMTGSEVFTPRDVVVGHEASGFYEVLDGLKAGEKVVTGGNFLVDAESRLKGAYDRKDH